MVLRIKALAAKPSKGSSILGSHMVEQNTPGKLSLELHTLETWPPVPQHAWRLEDNFVEFVLSFHHVYSRDCAQVSGRGSQHLYPRSHHAYPSPHPQKRFTQLTDSIPVWRNSDSSGDSISSPRPGLVG